MKTVRTVAELRTVLGEHRRAGATIGLVPTMGALHEGHLSLIRRARSESDVVVVSLFVNPTQFNEAADLDAYPRDEQRDAMLAGEAGGDILFAPTVAEVYPGGFATTVSVAAEITGVLEGARRGSGHFDGVTTVVTKLFNMVGPDVAFFGQKDAQQVAVIKRLVGDLDIPVRIEVGDTVREPDGLAMSSRNAHLNEAERLHALSLHRALVAADRAVADGAVDPALVTAEAVAAVDPENVELEYFELVSADTLAPVSAIGDEVLAVIAARVGSTRLIDNKLIQARPNLASGRVTHTNGRH
jgi:pantoate--beta-alanine ligase